MGVDSDFGLMVTSSGIWISCGCLLTVVNHPVTKERIEAGRCGLWDARILMIGVIDAIKNERHSRI